MPFDCSSSCSLVFYYFYRILSYCKILLCGLIVVIILHEELFRDVPSLHLSCRLLIKFLVLSNAADISKATILVKFVLCVATKWLYIFVLLVMLLLCLTLFFNRIIISVTLCMMFC